MKKEFSLQSFKSSAFNASDFLKSKGHNIPRSTMLNALSVFTGMKNWNTAHGILSSDNNKKDLLDFNSGLILISSTDPQKIINYIHNKVCFDLLKKNEKQENNTQSFIR